MEEDEAELKEELDQLIEEALHASDPDDRAYAVNELSGWDATPEVLTACLEALNDPEEEVREEAVLALETLEDPSVIPELQRVAGFRLHVSRFRKVEDMKGIGGIGSRTPKG